MMLRWAGLVSVPLWFAAPACRAPPGGREIGSGAAFDSLIAPGESLYVRGEYDSARALWTGALERPGVAGSAGEAHLVHWLGLASYRQGEYADARRLGERALALKRELGLSRAELAESQNALGLLAWNEGRLQDASALLRDALAGFEESRDRAGIAKSSNNLALVALELGRFAEAREGFGAARTAGRAIGNLRIENRATTNLAMIEIWAGDPQAAPVLLAESRSLADSANDVVGLENAFGQLAVAWAVLGEPGRALATMDSATAIAREHRLREEEANNLLVAGSIHREAGDAERALQLYRQARLINQELGLDVEAGVLLRNEARLLAMRDMRDRARTSVREALTLHRAAGARLEEFRDLLALATLEAEAGDAAAAAGTLAQSRRVALELDAPRIRVELALAEARAADRRTDPGGTLSALGGVADELNLAGADASIEAEWLRTRAFAALGRLDSAVASGRRAVSAIQRSAGNFGSPFLRTGLTSERSEAFADLVIVLLRLGQVEEAFLIADAARGRALLDHLASARSAASRGPMRRDLAERDRLLRAIDALLGRLEEVQTVPRQERGPETEATGRELAERLRQARAEYETVLIRLAEREPVRAGVIGTRVTSVESIRASLHPDELLVQYLATPERLVLFAMTRDNLRPMVVPITLSELENRVRLVRGLIATPNGGDTARTVLTELHRLLIGPLGESGVLTPGKRLVIVPHGVLSYLPFAALRHPVAGRYLVEDHAIQYLPTAAGLAALRAGPGAGVAPGRTTVFAPLPERLPATALEARAIAKTIRGSREIVGTSATEALLRRALSEVGAVHVASHGIMNPVNPMFSSLRLARGGSGSPEDDGRLEVHELLELTVATTLVYLSGCETALGGARTTRFDRAQDYTTLAQAFLYAGARGVVATLWRIDDEGASVFAERFYRAFQEQRAVDALAEAQRSLIADSVWRHPYHWAGYTIAGDGTVSNGANRPAVSVSR